MKKEVVKANEEMGEMFQVLWKYKLFKSHTFQPLRCSKWEIYNEPSGYLRWHHVATEGEILDISTPKSPGNAFSRVFTHLKLFLKYYKFAIFQHILCKTDDESLQKQAVNIDLQCILCITNSSYAVKAPKDEVTYDAYWNFYKKLKIWTCLPQNGRFWDQTGGRERTSQNGSLPFKTGGLEHMKIPETFSLHLVLFRGR